MATRKRKDEPLPTIWHVPDDLWERFKPVIDAYDPPAPTGRPRINQRAALDGIIFRMRTGCQWNRLPKEFGDDSSVHRTFQTWVKLGLLERLWAVMIEDCDELGGVDWQWQSADAALGKARFGGIKSERIPRIVRRMEPSAA